MCLEQGTFHEITGDKNELTASDLETNRDILSAGIVEKIVFVERLLPGFFLLRRSLLSGTEAAKVLDKTSPAERFLSCVYS